MTQTLVLAATANFSSPEGLRNDGFPAVNKTAWTGFCKQNDNQTTEHVKVCLHSLEFSVTLMHHSIFTYYPFCVTYLSKA